MDKPIKKNIKGIDVYYIKSKKFKTITWSFVFTHSPGTENINEYYFLSNILVDNMKKYSTFVKKYRYLSSLYGLDAFSSALVLGRNIINHFVVTYPNEIYIDGENSLSEKAFEFLNEVITNPKVRENKLTKKVLIDSLDEAKQSFSILKSIKDMYAYYNFSKLYYDDKPDLQYNFPEYERLNEVNIDTLTNTYFNMLSNSAVSLFVTGNFDEGKFDQIISDGLSSKIINNQILRENKKFPYDLNKKLKLKKVSSDVSQARIFIGYQTNINYYTDLHPAMSILNDILGGFDQSKLFLDIREKSHLAYYVDSQYIPDENMIVIPIVCEFKNEELVIDKVKLAIEEIISGDFSNEILEQARNNALNSLYSINDSQPIYLLQHIKTYHLFNKKYDLEERIKKYEAVSKEDIIAAAKTLVLDTIYICTKQV